MAAEVWILWTMLGISWTEQKSNDKVLREEWVGLQRTMMKRICQRQLSFFGHSMRMHGLDNFAADNMGLSLFKFEICTVGSKRRIFSATECTSAVQGHPSLSIILVPIESAYM